MTRISQMCFSSRAFWLNLVENHRGHKVFFSGKTGLGKRTASKEMITDCVGNNQRLGNKEPIEDRVDSVTDRVWNNQSWEYNQKMGTHRR